VPVGSQPPVAHCIDAAVDQMPPPDTRSMLDGTWSKPERHELPIRDDPMLPLGKLGNGSIEGGLEGA
jgi:hypothetical protein